ncbi:hypothetical protein [Nostoc sp.]|uniref:hypothetical protein n=1 Tax=Nostoc sp. TaxID=1180 RepID=UPI002FF88180
MVYLPENSCKLADASIQDDEAMLRRSKAKDLLKFASNWQGDDFEKCLQFVCDTRSHAEL